MGAKDSKPSFITYDEATKRVHESELKRIEDAFKKCAGSVGVPLSKAAFIQDVLGEGVPPDVGEWLFTTCGGTRRGITFKDLVCGLVLLTKGTHEERIKFLWTLYSNDAGTHINKWDFIKALQAENASLHPPGVRPICIASSESLAALFGRNSDRADFEQFRLWVLQRKEATVLSRWMLLDQKVSLTSELETPTFYQTLAGVTHLEERDISTLEKCFWSLQSRSSSGQLDLEVLAPLMSPPLPRAALPGLFAALDENRDGHVDFKELCCGLSAACRGPECERMKFCFKVFDCDRDGFLNQEELRHMCNILTFIANESIRNEGDNGEDRDTYKADTVYEALQDMVGHSGMPRRRSKRPSNERPHLRITRNDSDISKDEGSEKYSLDNNRVMCNNNHYTTNTVNLVELRDKESLEAEEHCEKEWGLSQEDFLIWSVERAAHLIMPLMTLINQVAHVVLGLRPLCRHHEQEIVLGWLSREVKRGYCVGQFWYLISTEWWNSWQAYTSSNNGNGGQQRSNGACGACGRRPPAHIPPVDEAIVCDESFNSNEVMVDTASVGSSSSSSGVSSSSSLRSTSRPGPIVNSHLLQQSPYKVRSLTGEGGYLRRDVTLAQHRDFELVPDSLWKALAQWYGGPQPLPRQVIQPPNSQVELELYPKTLRIYRHMTPGQQNNNSNAPQSSWSGMVGGYGAAALSSVGMASYQSTNPAQPSRYLAYTAAFSRLATVRQVCEFICSQLRLPREDVRLWMLGSPGTAGTSVSELLEEEGLSLDQLGLDEGHRLLLEIRNKDLTWPEEMGALSNLAASGSEGRGSLAGLAASTTPHPPGATGLHNLGNTCFMNAALQAVWNTGPLTMYFTKDMHIYEVNKDNPHSTKGELAQRYGELCKDVWCSSSNLRSIAPLRVRWCVSKHASRFSGGGQHDSQEFLAWLLDALHEDLNRAPPPNLVPYTELRDSDGRPDQEVAREAWELHTVRNKSIITDLFYGQLKSKVTCSVCGHESVRFDAFNMLSLPLPMENYIVVEVIVIVLEGGVPIKYGLRLNSDSQYKEVKEKVATLCGVPSACMLLVLGGWPPYQPFDSDRITALHCTIYETPPMMLLDLSLSLNNTGGVTVGGEGEVRRPPTATSDTRIPSLCMPALFCFKRSSISSDYEGSPTNSHTNYLNAKNINSLDMCNNGSSSGYNSIQDLDSALSTSYYNNNNTASPKKVQILNKNVKGSPSASIKSLNASPKVHKKYESNGSSINRGRSEEILLQPTVRSNKNSPLLSVRKDMAEGTMSSNSSTAKFEEEPEPRVKNYLLAVHRKQSRQESYFLSQQKRRWETFGSPVVVEIREGCGGRELYGAVWRQVERLLSAPPPQPPDQANHATDCDDSLGYTFPFTLRVVGPRALRCAVCPWTSFCRGCALPCTDSPLITNLYSYSNSPVHTYPTTHHIMAECCEGGRESIVKLLDMSQLREGEVYLAVDWEPTALHLRYQSNREKLVVEHESVRECRAGATAPVQLQHCLHSFTQEERLEEVYACSACVQRQPATKKLQIWRLPPVLIIHLKRFQYVNRKWIKSHKAVNFPFQDFDPTSFLASVPQETILRHAEVKLHRANKLLLRKTQALSEDCEVDSGTKFTDQMIAEEVLGGLNTDDNLTDDELQNEEDVSNECRNKSSSNTNKMDHRKSSVIASTRERLVSTSLSKTPVVDDEFVDFHQHKLKPSEDAFDLKYRLCAVVSHSGMMNGGHYVAYARNPSGTWYYYNDSSCKGLSGTPQPNLDPSTAYLLFYERVGLDHEAYLPDIQDCLPRVEKYTQLAEGEDADLKKMCSIS